MQNNYDYLIIGSTKYLAKQDKTRQEKRQEKTRWLHKYHSLMILRFIHCKKKQLQVICVRLLLCGTEDNI